MIKKLDEGSRGEISTIATLLSEIEHEENESTLAIRSVVAGIFEELATGNVEEVRSLLEGMLSDRKISEQTADWLNDHLLEIADLDSDDTEKSLLN